MVVEIVVMTKALSITTAEMCAAIDVQDVTSDRRGVGQVQDGVRDGRLQDLLRRSRFVA